MRRAKNLLDVIVYRESTAGEKRGSGRWMWKLPMVELVEDDVQGGHTAPKQNGAHLEQVKGTRTRESGLDKPDVQDGHVVSSRWPDVQDGQRSSLPEGGHLKECIHDYPEGKGCYLCDPNHPHRLKEGAKT